jgi:hypothetical protein
MIYNHYTTKRWPKNWSCRISGSDWSILNRQAKETPAVNEQELRKRLAGLKTEHRDLDAAIDAMLMAGSTDQLQIARLKKRKLLLKDQIAMVEDALIPDIIA